MIEFFNALYALFIATEDDAHNDFYNAVEGRFSYGETLPRGPKPYAVFFGVSCLPADTFTENLDDLSFQVNCYAKQHYREAGQVVRKCRDLFDGATVTVNGYEIRIRRDMETPPWRDGELWCASIEFNALIQGA
jgi:hypothetical protein